MPAAGISQGPTPWWQTPGNDERYQNLTKSAPAGYTYDPVKMAYTQIAGSAPDTLAQRQRQQGIEDQLRQQQTGLLANEETRRQQAFTQQQSQRGALTGQLQSALAGLSHSGQHEGGYFPGTAVPMPNQVSFNPTSVSAPSTATADSAAFGAAKARAGSLGRSAVEGLRGDLAERGILGSGVEARGLTDRLAAATNPLSDLNVAQQHEAVGMNQHAQDLAAQQQATQFQGNIAQRGQDIGARESAAQQGLQARQLAQQQQIAQLQMLQAALSGLNRIF